MMLAALGFSPFFPLGSEEFRSCNWKGNGLTTRGENDGLISLMGDRVFGSASPVAINFATAGAMSLRADISRQFGY